MKQRNAFTLAMTKLRSVLGISSTYQNTKKELVVARDEVVLEVARQLLQIPISTDPDSDEIEDLCSTILKTKYKNVLEPVYAVLQGQEVIQVYLEEHIHEIDSVEIELEQGEKIFLGHNINIFQIVGNEKVGRLHYQIVNFPLPQDLPVGYHQLKLTINQKSFHSLLLRPPKQCFHLPNTKAWGVFAPLYALRSQSSQGIGDYSDLAKFGSSLQSMGADVVSTLPLLPGGYEPPVTEISPYSALSRLFWSEIHIDLTQIPEIKDQISTRSIEQLWNQGPNINYSSVWEFKKKWLQRAFEKHIQTDQHKLHLIELAKSRPLLASYATFRSQMQSEQYQNELFFIYLQWLAETQLENASRILGKGENGLYADIPIGSHPDGFDCWYYRDLFCSHLNIGAPPDSLFVRGQNWGFWALNIQKLRESHYQYYIQMIRHHFQFARMVRIDHILGLHRVFLIPRGMTAADGVYQSMPWKEFYSIMAIESHRHGCAVIGEALGTVPPEVIPCMNSFGMHQLWVLQYELEDLEESQIQKMNQHIHPNAAVGHNTHDMPPFAAFCLGLDLDMKLELKLADQAQVSAERSQRIKKLEALSLNFGLKDQIGPDGIFPYAQLFEETVQLMAESDAPILIINLEDIWGETESQNVPGTSTERANWQRKTRFSLEEIESDSACHRIFKLIQYSRNQSQKKVSSL